MFANAKMHRLSPATIGCKCVFKPFDGTYCTKKIFSENIIYPLYFL